MEQVLTVRRSLRDRSTAHLEIADALPITIAHSIWNRIMYNTVSARAANAYRKVGVETAVDGASAHQLIGLLFDGLRQAIAAAEVALLQGDAASKGLHIVRAVRFLEEGLKGGLDDARGGELTLRLRALYDYCINRLTIANLRNDVKALAEVAALVAPVASAWGEIAGAAAAVPGRA